MHWPTIETDLKASTGPEYSGAYPDRNITDGTYTTCAAPAMLASSGVPNQAQGLSVDL